MPDFFYFRYCSMCREYHPTKEGDVWKESKNLFGYRILARLGLYVVDITAWADCHRSLTPSRRATITPV